MTHSTRRQFLVVLLCPVFQEAGRIFPSRREVRGVEGGVAALHGSGSRSSCDGRSISDAWVGYRQDQGFVAGLPRTEHEYGLLSHSGTTSRVPLTCGLLPGR